MKNRCAICKTAIHLVKIELLVGNGGPYLMVNQRSPKPNVILCELCVRQIKRLPFSEFLRKESDIPF